MYGIGRITSSAGMERFFGLSGKVDLSGAVRVWFAVVLGVLLLPCLAQAKYGGGRGSVISPYLIYTAEQLDEVGQNPRDWRRHFELRADIDMSGYTGAEFNIIGVWDDTFTGTFDGNDHTISNFTYSSVDDGEAVGLFGFCEGAGCEIRNVGLVDVEVSGVGPVGGLAGGIDGATVVDCFVTGSVSGAAVTTGGLIGQSSGDVIGCFTRVDVSADFVAGGLVGVNLNGVLTDCYSAGGVVDANYPMGGLAGVNWYDGVILNCYSANRIRGFNAPAGFVGANEGGSISGSFWDKEVSVYERMCSVQVNGSGCDNSLGMTTEQMRMGETFVGQDWDFGGEVWTICEGTNYPRLAWQRPVAGDFLCPNGVDWRDFSELSAMWLVSSDEAGWDDVFDISAVADGIVDWSDVEVLAENWLADTEK